MYICSCSLFLEPAVSYPSGRHVKSPLLTSPYTWQTSQSVTYSPLPANLSLPCRAKSHSPPAFPPFTVREQQGKGVRSTVCCPLSVLGLTTPRRRDSTIPPSIGHSGARHSKHVDSKCHSESGIKLYSLEIQEKQNSPSFALDWKWWVR